MTTCSERWSQQLEASDAAAAEDNWDRAEELLQKSYQDWSSYQSYLHIVARHEAVDGAEAMYFSEKWQRRRCCRSNPLTDSVTSAV